jgi:hypothetical protein
MILKESAETQITVEKQSCNMLLQYVAFVVTDTQWLELSHVRRCLTTLCSACCVFKNLLDMTHRTQLQCTLLGLLLSAFTLSLYVAAIQTIGCVHTCLD